MDREREHPKALLILGAAHWRCGRHGPAVDVLSRAVDAGPDDTHALKHLGVVAKEAARFDLAAIALERLVLLAPADAAAHRVLAEVHLAAGKVEDAKQSLAVAAVLEPDSARHQTLLGKAFELGEELEAAAGSLRRAIDADGSHALAHAYLGDVLSRQGDDEAGQWHRRRAVELDPTDARVAFVCKDLRRYEPDDAQAAAIAERLAAGAYPPEQRPNACLALAKMRRDAGDLVASAALIAEANEQIADSLADSGRSYDPAVADARAAQLERSFAESGPPTEATAAHRHLLLLGAPRSGKTLLETRLAPHPEVTAGGESRLGTLLDEVRKGGRDASRRADGDSPVGLGQALAELARDCGTAVRTSSVASNTWLAGVLVRAAPSTLAVSVERDPRDLLLACYEQRLMDQHAWSFTVDGLVHYLATHLRMVELWERVLPGGLLRIRYEDLVTEPEPIVARVLEHAGLDWDEACRVAASETPADFSVDPTVNGGMGAPVHPGYIGAWKAYAEHLPELFDAIEEAGLLERVVPRMSEAAQATP